MTKPPDTKQYELKELLLRYWGVSELRQLQLPAINAVLAGRDSLVVMPTGGASRTCSF
jgi:ATP-dependent DNA helicase RecQ